MVYCVVIGCSNKSDLNKDVSFYRIPKVMYGRSQRKLELSRRRREGYLAAISRAELTESIIENGRICSKHFLSGKPASLFDETSPSWLPTEKLGHSKICRKRVVACQERYQRKKARFDKMNARAASASLLPEQVSQTEERLVDETLSRSEGDDYGEPDDQETEVQTA